MSKRENPEKVSEAEKEGTVRTSWDKTAEGYSPEKRGEFAIDAALNRGRELKQSLMEKAGPLLKGIQNRITSLANRGLSLIAKFIGHSAEAKDTALEINEKAPAGFGAMGKQFMREFVLSPAEAVRDMLNPVVLSERSKKELSDIGERMQEINDKLGTIGRGAERDALVKELDTLQREEDEIRNPPQSQRGGVQLAKKTAIMAGTVLAAPVVGAGMLGAAGMKGAAELGAAGIEAVKEMRDEAATAGREMVESAGDYAAEKVAKLAEAAMEKEEKYLVIGEIANKALSEILGKEIKLTYPQIVSLGASLDAAGLAKNFAMGTVENVKDLVEMAKGNAKAMNAMLALISNPETQRALEERFRRLGVELGTSIKETAEEIGAAAWDTTRTVGKGVAIGTAIPLVIAGGAAATLATSAAFAAGAAASAPLVAGGALGYGAYKAAEKGAEKAQDVWKGVRPEIQKAADRLIEGILSRAERAKKGVKSGISGLDAAAIELELALRQVEIAGHEKITAGIAEMDKIAREIGRGTEEAAERVQRMIDVAQNARNEMRLALAGEMITAESKETLDGIRNAVKLLDSLENATDVPKPENLRAEEVA